MQLGFWEIISIVIVGFLLLGPKDFFSLFFKLKSHYLKLKTEFNNIKVMAEEEISKVDTETIKFKKIISNTTDINNEKK